MVICMGHLTLLSFFFSSFSVAVWFSFVALYTGSGGFNSDEPWEVHKNNVLCMYLINKDGQRSFKRTSVLRTYSVHSRA